MDCGEVGQDLEQLGRDLGKFGTDRSENEATQLATDLNALQQDVAYAKTHAAKRAGADALDAASQVGNTAAGVKGAAGKLLRFVDAMEKQLQLVCGVR